jgi:cell adhesion molecule, putative
MFYLLSERPEINSFTFKKNVKINGKASVFCSLSSGTPPFKFEWLKSGLKISNSDDLRIDIGKDYSALIIEALSVEDNGNYTCIVSNNHGTDSYTALLTIDCKFCVYD